MASDPMPEGKSQLTHSHLGLRSLPLVLSPDQQHQHLYDFTLNPALTDWDSQLSGRGTIHTHTQAHAHTNTHTDT